MTPDDIAEMDRQALAAFGKPIMECTFDQIRELLARDLAEVARLGSGIDQMRAAEAEGAACGCEPAVPIDQEGRRDWSRVRIVHRCARASATGTAA